MNKFGVVGVPSVRTYEYEAVCGVAKKELPKTFILPDDRIPDLTDQEQFDACCAYAVAQILQIFYRMEHGKNVQFSKGLIYGLLRNAEAKYRGMNPASLVEWLCKYGSVDEALYNELYEMPEMREKILAHPQLQLLLEYAEKNKIEGFVGFLRSNYEDMKAALYEKQYPLFAISNSYFGGSHAIIIIGWDENGFIIQNSWGKGWGNNGRKTIPTSAITYSYLLIDEVLKLKFTDVKETDWYFKAIKECVFNGFMNGVSEDKFAPEANLTRGQAAQLIVNVQRKNDEVNKILSDQIVQLREENEKLKKWAITKGYKE